MKAVIIGSGIAGLTAGSKLAKEGVDVTIFEQYAEPGGVTATIKKDGYQWDLGQLMLEGFGKDEPIGQILTELGIYDQVPSVIDQRGYVFPDFEIRPPEKYIGPKWRMDYLKNQFPDDAKGLDRYWKDYLRFSKLMTFGRKADRASGLAKTILMARLYWTLLPLLPKAKWNADQLMSHYFKNEGTWEERKEEFADKLLAYAEKYIPGLLNHTLTRVILTPADFRALTHSKHHAFGGLAPVMNKPNIEHKTPIKGLWFIGQQSKSGGGVANVMPSSYKVAKEILKK